MNRIIFLLLALAILWLLNSCVPRAGKKDDTCKGTIIVASKSGNDVYFLCRETGETLAILPTGLEPHEVEVSDDGRIAVVCNYGNREEPGNTLSVYDVGEAKLIRTIDLGEHTRPHGMQWISGTNKMLVTTEGSLSLLIVNTETGAIEKAMFTDQDVSHMVAATPDFKRAFVPSIRTGNVTVFDLETGELITQLYSGRGAEGIDVSPDGKEVWVTNRADNTISVFDTESLELLATLDCEDFPIRAKFTPDGSRFLVSNARSGTIAVFDAIEKALIRYIKLTPPVPADTDQERYFAEFTETSIPIGLVIPDNKTAYVANTRSDAVTVIDLEKLEITGHFNAGNEPDGINFSPLVPGR
jgi:YVTN family beta-propeller protein